MADSGKRVKIYHRDTEAQREHRGKPVFGVLCVASVSLRLCGGGEVVIEAGIWEGAEVLEFAA
jgi:hypothetical protein